MSGSSRPDAGAPTALCVSVSAALGGSEWCLLDFLRGAERNGVRAALAVPKEGPLADEARAAGIPVVLAAAPVSLLDLAQRGGLGPGAILTLLGGLRSWAAAIERAGRQTFGAPPAVLYSNGFKAHLAGMLVRGPKRVWHLHEFPPDGLGIVWRALAGFLPTATIANSRAVGEAWRLALGVTPAVVLNGVDLARFRPAARSGWLHEQLDVPREAQLVGMPAVLARWKGHLQVVEAFEQAAGALGAAHLVFAGGAIYDTSAERGYAEELVRRVGRSSLPGTRQALHPRIHFVKHQREPWRLYPEFTVTVHFSTRPEPFGRVVAESLASGVPVIAAKAGGPVEIVDEGMTGWLVPMGDVRALRAALETALTADAATVAGMRDACRRSAEQRFDAARFAAEVAAVLRRAVGGTA
jgi:glycosyltransferase involved in cell wall biosynthesis